MTIKVGILGLGTVGCGAVNILHNNQAWLEKHTGQQIFVVAAAARDLNKPRDCDLTGVFLTDNPLEVVNHPDVEVVIELMGGTGIAKDAVMAAIALGKSVVTANKALLATQGNEIFAAAQQQGVLVAYEAAVAGGIPIIKTLREGLVANRIQWLAGIINGTGNYILTEMKKPAAEFVAVLKRAQALGYAEADPTFDVEGIDAAHKLTILASIAFGMPLNFAGVYTQGISKITAEDIRFAQHLGYEIKHLGIARQTSEGVEMRVHPSLVPKDVLLAQVNGVMNAVMVGGDQVPMSMYYGPGAGAGPTASAVIADLVDVVRARSQPVQDRVHGLGFVDPLASKATIPMENVVSEVYLRMRVADKPGVLWTITKALADEGISIEKLHQEPNGDKTATVVLITNAVQESRVNAAIAAMDAMPKIEPVAHIRVAGF